MAQVKFICKAIKNSIMKKYHLLSTLFLFLAFTLTAQNVKKIPLVEHFSNTRCPICASKSPALNATLKANEGKVHHITYHPPYPYDDCIFYVANKTGNQGRADYYNVPGTPRAYLNGVKTSGSKLLPEASLASELELSSPVGIIVTEDVTTGDNTMHTAEITLKTLGDKPAGSYKLYVAVVEKIINYNAPNGETVHHDVFRKFLNFNTSSGQNIALPTKGDSLVLNFDFTIDNNWQEEEIYVLAFVQNDSDKSILNSGTATDELISSNNYIINNNSITFSPNPIRNELSIRSVDKNVELGTVLIYNTTGQLIQSFESKDWEKTRNLNLSHLNAGIYFLNINTKEGKLIKKVLKL